MILWSVGRFSEAPQRGSRGRAQRLAYAKRPEQGSRRHSSCRECQERGAVHGRRPCVLSTWSSETLRSSSPDRRQERSQAGESWLQVPRWDLSRHLRQAIRGTASRTNLSSATPKWTIAERRCHVSKGKQKGLPNLRQL